MKRNLYILLAFLVLAGVVVYQSAGDKIQAAFQQEKPMPTETKPQAGYLAPAFTATGLDGKEYRVGGVQDKAILVNFWASWCDPCQQEAPELHALAEKYKDDLNIYGINVTKYDNKKNAKSFVEKYDVNFPVMLDLKGTIYDQYKGAVFPTNVLIDKNGVVQDVILGILPSKDLEKKIKHLIES
ncbi:MULTISPECIES: TlpA disulfide reductase family protein [unclassified Paenibacillus]|uniref:TlpA family protein disulfide reductase n=1 Tax=unclassified Paenibacillus TaxID=185978 RepID=UPI000CF855D7|nr:MULTISPECIES: TlpA disulfide reductase family protein [unclassified Paenibacillus]MBJ9989110.1 TlpA family protein disulfide reductase [Paenibacillus sp. S28]PQP91069.1 redoxin [Paenibacillus sp. AR247]